MTNTNYYEFLCLKCGNSFVDTLHAHLTIPGAIHWQLVDNDGIDHGPCGGFGIPLYEFSKGFTNTGRGR